MHRNFCAGINEMSGVAHPYNSILEFHITVPGYSWNNFAGKRA
ncbi:unnamed protein product [Chondrus crispus]|uniref:Uncharacterized protein n=1 Tax=Chondrus crispus TaxID=2769 RepID=R7QLE6_CHOCR|nr:unnamed protein product [Chondrus crispus]CDF38301.1 unnamed protein product [Chondrus crispus]|eukprot:XP_005718186.1 unnamed protein product [Chondrus crispus]